MQTLATTARENIALFGKKYGLTCDSFDVAPATKAKPNPAPTKHPMYEPATSIDLGTAEIRRRWSKTGDDPIQAAAAYSSGGLYQDDVSSWGLRARGNHLDRATEWRGDACAVLSENRTI
jgi:peptidoglycan L-alanyl-D-glutamate endopeptidase CwlK